MNAFVKKEIRLLLPGWAVAALLALPAICTRADDGMPVVLLFLGMTMMGLASIGRESSLNTFSQILAQPIERARIWQIKLTVLATAFLSVFIIWWLATIFSFKDYGDHELDIDSAAAVRVSACLVLVATFTGVLWAPLLLRQMAGAFWLALLVPTTLAGFTTGFASVSETNNGVIVAVCIILGVYSLGGFLFARWLFFRAQDVGWTGGIVGLPELKIFRARSGTGEEIRGYRPWAALIKKEFQLQQISLMGAGLLLALHAGVVIWRSYHTYKRNSAGEILTSICWMLWLVLPVVIGAMSIAEERRLGMMEGQLCQPAARRKQFFIKGGVTLLLGIFLGGIMPCLVEFAGGGFRMGDNSHSEGMPILLGFAAFCLWLSVVSLFASSLSRNFLQAVGLALATFIFSSLTVPALTKGRMFFFDSVPMSSLLTLVIAGPALVVTLFGLAYWNYKTFRDAWYLFRRSVLVFFGALGFSIFLSTAIYNRGWEIFKPAEPAHGAAILSRANPPALRMVDSRNLLVRLPDGRIWFDYIDGAFYGIYYGDRLSWRLVTRMLLNPLPESHGPQRFIAGSNWVTATTARVDYGRRKTEAGKIIVSKGYLDTVGIKADGTLWVSDKSEQDKWTADTLNPFGEETNWSQLAQYGVGVVLLKKDGTLWHWGAVSNAWQNDWTHDWPGLKTFTPYRIGTNSDWQNLFLWGQVVHARKNNGDTWALERNWRAAKDQLYRETNLDDVALQTTSTAGELQSAFVRTNGTLWVLNRYWDEKERRTKGTGALQIGKDADWQAVTVAWGMMVALKSDGTLWEWHYPEATALEVAHMAPKRLGIHSDWVAISSVRDSILALAADGSLWFWPDKEYPGATTLLQFPKQPQFLGNVLSKAE
ncbi:MAG TPA: ABC transporter permease [Verrucomicrobiae bacterium]|nr:ABC transporter permease [Verrucomicrobiae bacterium]